MSKGKAEKLNIPEPKRVKHGKFTNSAGEEFAIAGMSPLEAEQMRAAEMRRWQDNGRSNLLEKVTYKVMNVAGVEQEFEYDAETISDADEQVKAAYTAHVNAVREFESAVNARIMKVCFLCVIGDPLKDSEWIDRMEFLGVDLPKGKSALKNLYVESRVLKSTDDIGGLMSAVMLISGIVDEETAAAAEATFRSALQEKTA